MAELRERLRAALAEDLPGMEAQFRMAAYPRPPELANPDSIQGYRPGAVLILIYPHFGEWHTLLIRRQTYEGVHSAQIAFPGGAWESTDPDIVSTALREASEEVGIGIHEVEIIGRLSELFIAPSRFRVTPVVGWSSKRPDFIPDTHEVASLIETPLDWLLDPGRVETRDIYIPLLKRKLEVPCYIISDEVVWGATAMMISEFCAVFCRLQE